MNRVFITRISFLKKHKGFCRKLHFLIKTNIQCLMSDNSQHADKCTFQLIHFVFSLRLKLNLGKAFRSFKWYICGHCLYRFSWKVLIYFTRYKGSQSPSLIHHFMSFIQFAFSSCCGKIGRLKRWHFKLPTSLAIITIIHSFSQFSDYVLFHRTICPFSPSHLRLKVNGIFLCNWVKIFLIPGNFIWWTKQWNVVKVHLWLINHANLKSDCLKKCSHFYFFLLAGDFIELCLTEASLKFSRNCLWIQINSGFCDLEHVLQYYFSLHLIKDGIRKEILESATIARISFALVECKSFEFALFLCEIL